MWPFGVDTVTKLQNTTARLAKGSTIKSTLDFLAREAAPETVEVILSRLTWEERRLVESATPTVEMPYELSLSLWRAADHYLRDEDPGWVERAAAWSISSIGVQLYGGIIKKATPEEFLAQHVSLFQLYYQPGNMEIVAQSPGYAVTRLIGFDPGDTLLCRRLTAGWITALGLARGRDTSARHVRCTLEGDHFCEWEVRWRPESARNARSAHR